MDSNFFALISRMRYIARWGLMRNALPENIQEHSHMVAVLAHALALIRTRVYGIPTDANAVAVAALYHDATEILTGDMPTPIKYYNPEIRDAYRKVETVAGDKLLSMLPEDMRPDYQALFFPGDGFSEEQRIVKAADKLSALIKCVEEKRQGNREFEQARRSTEEAIRAMRLPAADCFLEEFLPAFELTLDEQN